MSPHAAPPLSPLSPPVPLGARLLAVHPQPAVRAHLAQVLGAAGHRVQTAASADEALRLLAGQSTTEPVMAVVGDLLQPEVTRPLSAVAALRSRFGSVEVLLLADEPSVELATEALRLGVRDYLFAPVTAEELTRAVAQVLGLAPTQRPTGAASPTVLVVEDEAPLRHLLTEVLTAEGYTVLPAADGESALSLMQAAAQPVDLALLDLMMPTIGGLELFGQLRAINPELRALLCTAFSDRSQVDAFLASGGLGVVKKPFQLTLLLTQVRQALGPRAVARLAS